MKSRATPLVLAALIVPAACTPTPDTAAEEAALRALSSHWQELDEEQDADAVTALFAEDATVYWGERPPALGTEAIRAHMETLYAENPNPDGGWGPDRYQVAASGDLAVEHGTWEDGGDSGRYVTVYEKLDGGWKIAADLSMNPAPDGAIPDWARTSLEAWYEAFNARDAAALSAMYTSDAVVGDARGRRAIAARFEAGWAEADLQCSGSYDGFRVSGDFATGWGRDTCRSAESGEVVERSTWLSVYDRQPDGSWLAIRDNGVPVG